MKGNNIIAVIDLPHNTFRPHCNAKTCLLVLKKNEPQQDTVIMATPVEMGHDHTGRILSRPETDEIWDDLAEVLQELDNPESPDNRHVFTLPWAKVDTNVLVPRYYRETHENFRIPSGRVGITLGKLVEDRVIGAWDGHGSPRSQEKGRGKIPYIRVSDIVNWELYRNPVSGIPEDEYIRVLGKGKSPETGDIVFVRRGSYRIGTVAMASPRDSKVLLTKELHTFRILDQSNKYGITPFYLLAALSSKSVQDQIANLVCIDTTLPTIGDRWKNLMLPIHSDPKDVESISQRVESSIREKWSAQERIDSLRDELGGVTT